MKLAKHGHSIISRPNYNIKMGSLSLRTLLLATALVFAATAAAGSLKKGFELTSVLPQYPATLQLNGLNVSEDSQWTNEHWKVQANVTFVGLDRLNAVLDGPLCGVDEEQYGLTMRVPNLAIRGRMEGDVLFKTCVWISCVDNHYIGSGDFEVIFGEDEKEDTIDMLARIRENPETGLVEVYEVDKWFSYWDLSDAAVYENVTGTWDGKPMDAEHFRQIGWYSFQIFVPQFTPTLREQLQEALEGMTLAQLHQQTGGCP